MFKPLLTNLQAGRRRISSVLPNLEMPTTVEVRGEPRPLRVRVHANARRMILRFDVRSGEGRLTVPHGTPASAALTFLSQSRGWIDGHAPELPSAQGALYPDSLPFLGEEHRIIPTGRIRGTVSRDAENTLSCAGRAAPHHAKAGPVPKK
jgi:predicted metal-dependent hydrolase